LFWRFQAASVAEANAGRASLSHDEVFIDLLSESVLSINVARAIIFT
jgi:hypothetical protein